MTIRVYTRSQAFKQHLVNSLPPPLQFSEDLADIDGEHGTLLVLHRQSFALAEWSALMERAVKVSEQICVADDQPCVDQLVACVQNNVKAYCNSYMVRQHYQQLVSLLQQGGSWFPPQMLQDVFLLAQQQLSSINGPQSEAVLAQLTEREREIVSRLVEGRSNRDIASACGVTERTVKAHLTNIYSKTGVTGRAELLRRFNRDSMIS